ncbi:MAG: aminotransferase class V-fold PLP-dependent enzyme [Acidobacteriia bacterium]|nr:aminotransferase class V-fold PLP-dependent enzyme [Terriglobia bacterium]
MPNSLSHSRRDLFRFLPAASAVGSWALLQKALTAAPGAPSAANEDYWKVVKNQFPLEDGLLYLNAANVCPASRAVMDRHLEYLRDFHANPSFQNRDKYEPLAERVRAKIAAMLRVTPDEIALTRNTSEASNTIVKGLDLKAGDEILITDHNHPSNNDSWKVRASRDGLVVKSLPVAVLAKSSQQLLDAFASAITPRTRVIAVTHVTSTTGIQYPAREIAALARQKGIWMHLDGAQTWGALDVNLHEIGCDSYAGSMHKWAMGPLEAGILFVKSEKMDRVWPSIVTAGWSGKLVGARKLEVYGQRDNPRLVAVEAAIDFLNMIGMNHVEARMRALTTYAKQQLREMPAVNLKTNLEPELSGGVIKFDLPKLAPRAAYDTLWKRHRVAIAVTDTGDAKGLRFSPHVYNTMEEMQRAVAAVRELQA